MEQDQARATCGHIDLLGYLAGITCARCAREGHARAIGKASRLRRRK